LKALDFLELPAADMVRQLDEWDDGNDSVGFKEFVLSFVDDVIFPFPPGDKVETWTDWFLGTVGGIGFDQLEDMVRQYLNVVTEARPLAGVAAKLRERINPGGKTP